MGDTFVIGRKALTLAAVVTAKSAGNTGRQLGEDSVVVFKNESFLVARPSKIERTSRRLGQLGIGARVSMLTFCASCLVIVLRLIIYLGLDLITWNAKITEAVEPEVIIIGLVHVSECCIYR